MMTLLIEWELIRQNTGGYLYRTKVPNGWLVKEVQDTQNMDTRIGMNTCGNFWTSSLVFIPDFEHLWVV